MPQLSAKNIGEKSGIMTPKIRDILNSHKKVLLVGVGNVLKRDDGVGVYICQRINKSDGLDILVVEASIEKYIGKINQLDPDILVLVDCMYHPDKKPGEVIYSSLKDVSTFVTNTHNITLGNIRTFFEMEVYILGIQPQNISYGEGLSPIVQKSAEDIISEINEISL